MAAWGVATKGETVCRSPYGAGVMAKSVEEKGAQSCSVSDPVPISEVRTALLDPFNVSTVAEELAGDYRKQHSTCQ